MVINRCLFNYHASFLKYDDDSFPIGGTVNLTEMSIFLNVLSFEMRLTACF